MSKGLPKLRALTPKPPRDPLIGTPTQISPRDLYYDPYVRYKKFNYNVFLRNLQNRRRAPESSSMTLRSNSSDSCTDVYNSRCEGANGMDYLLDQNSKPDNSPKSLRQNSSKFAATKKSMNSSISIQPSDISFDGSLRGANTRKNLDDSSTRGGINPDLSNDEIELSVKIIFGRQTRKRQVPWAGRLDQFDSELATVSKLFPKI
jgi:hypothetical protein